MNPWYLTPVRMLFHMWHLLSLSLQIKTTIQESFDGIRQALDFREKLLLRQVHVLHQNQAQLANGIEFIPENEANLLHLIRIFGKFNISKFNVNVNSDFLSNEDYICPKNDHVIMYKQLIDPTGLAVQNQPQPKEFLMGDENANNLNDTLIALILNESKELIESKFHQNETNENKPPTTKERHGNKKTIPTAAAARPPKMNRNSSSSISNSKAQAADVAVGLTPSPSTATSVSERTQTTSKKKFSSLKNISNLTLNSGTLNLRNITNLTINTTCTNPRPTAINSGAQAVDYDVQAVSCDFYKRLINENKLNCCRHLATAAAHHHHPGSPAPSDISGSTSFMDFGSVLERGMLDNWKGFDGLPKDANGNVLMTSDRPKQIHQWLKQIINEPELEPMQNTELLEFSRIVRA